MYLQRLNKLLDDFFLLKGNRTFPELDGVRAAAILMVFMSHAGSWMNNIMADSPVVSPTAQNIYEVVRFLPLFGAEGGGIGVDIFFMLSGFLIFMTIYKNKPSLKTFLFNRLMRLMPVHVFLIAVLATSVSFLTAILNLFMIVDFFPAFENVNLVSWTLGYEILFYILAAVWLIVYRKSTFTKSWHFLISLILLLLASQLVLPDAFSRLQLKYPDMTRFIAFISGVALAKMYFLNQRKWKSLEKYVSIGLIPAILLIVLIRYQHNALFLQNNYGLFWKSVAAIVLNISLFVIFARILAKRDSVIKQILRNRYVRIVGVVSYSMYLYHYTFALPMAKSMLVNVPSTSYKLLLFIPVSLLISVIGAAFLFHFLEKPYFLRKRS